MQHFADSNRDLGPNPNYTQKLKNRAVDPDPHGSRRGKF